MIISFTPHFFKEIGIFIYMYNPKWLKNNVSNDVNLTSDSTSDLVTEHATKTYIDTKTNNTSGIYQFNLGDSTAIITFDTPLSNSIYKVSGCISNTTDLSPALYVWIVVEKTESYFKILLSGNIISNNYNFEWVINT